MGLRSRIKDRLKSALGRGEDSGATSPAGAMPTTAATPAARPAPAPAAPAPKPAEAKPAEAPAPAAAEPSPDEAAKKQEKIRKHRLKTKAGVLRWLGEQEGGQARLADMHDYSERRFFVAHRGFSDLMEELTDQELVTWDAEAGIATITDAGRTWRA